MTARVVIRRTARLPDPVRLERYRKHPQVGPKLLFFGGGTALRELSRRLIDYTHNSIHLLTPFDSGGSSAQLRKAFRMLAVGDLRNRLMALADQSVLGQPAIFALFSFRFPLDEEQERLRRWLKRMIDGVDPMIAAIDHPMRKIIRAHLRFFSEQMPDSFDLRGANIGNLILAGGFLNQGRHIDPVIYTFSKLVEVRGLVRPTATKHLHLVAELEDGTVLAGQHLMTGKEATPIRSPIARVYLSRRRSAPEPIRLEARPRTRKVIGEADVICYPMGSFYSSLIANLLPVGVGQAIADNDVPKVYVPNTTADPEQIGMTLAASVRTLLDYLRQSCERPVADGDLLQFVLVDRAARDPGAKAVREVERLGVQVVDAPLVARGGDGLVDGERLAQVLLSLT